MHGLRSTTFAARLPSQWARESPAGSGSSRPFAVLVVRLARDAQIRLVVTYGQAHVIIVVAIYALSVVAPRLLQAIRLVVDLNAGFLAITGETHPEFLIVVALKRERTWLVVVTAAKNILHVGAP
jgi:hypothetical protein